MNFTRDELDSVNAREVNLPRGESCSVDYCRRISVGEFLYTPPEESEKIIRGKSAYHIKENSNFPEFELFVFSEINRRFPSCQVGLVKGKNKHFQGAPSWKRIYRSQFPKAIFTMID